ncbi:MAG: LysM peptidoglycan-binding domain-containing protein [Aggregatilineales bacterium]
MRFWVRLLSIMLVLLMAAGFVMAQDDSTEDEAADLPDLPLVSDYTYIIESGDRLDELAARFDVRLECLRAVNELTSSDSDIIQPGDELLIDLDCPAYDGDLEVRFPRTSAPTGTTATTASSESSSSTGTQSPNAGTTYVVQARDTLDTIGQALDVSVVSLRRANDLEGNSRIFPGDVLSIPDDAVRYGITPPSPLGDVGGGQGGGGVDGEIYVVQPRDTLDTIAQAFDISVVQLRRDNNLEDSSVILPGLQLVIAEEDNRTPYGQFPPTIAPIGAEGGGQGGGVDGDIYVVQPRDTFDTIAQEFDISVVQLRNDNGFMDSSVLMPGQQLIVASEENRTPYGQFPPLGDPLGAEGGGQGGGVDGDIYVIQPRDTLDTIAQEYNVSVIQLQQINLLENSVILPGQQLVIPFEEDRVPYGQFPAIIDPLGGEGGGQGGGADGIAVVVLQPRQTIDGIAQEYNVSNACIIEGNNITNTRNIRPGTQLVIPNGCPPYGGASPSGTSESDDDAAG